MKPSSLAATLLLVAAQFLTFDFNAAGTAAPAPEVVCWGSNAYGLTNVTSGLDNVVAVAAGGVHCLALTAGGQVVAWGLNIFAQTTFPNELSNVVAITTGTYHSLALLGETTMLHPGRLVNPRLAAEGFRADLPTDRGKTYVLECKGSLSDPQWTLLRLIAGDGAVRSVVDPIGAASHRFYRARRMP